MLLLAMLATEVKSEAFPPGTLWSECRDRHFYMWLDKTFIANQQWDVEIEDGPGHFLHVTKIIASQCGYTIGSDLVGNVELRVSYLGCLIENLYDEKFTLSMQLRVSDATGRELTYPHLMTCSLGNPWSPREIVCEENYMEVSVRRSVPPMAADSPIEDWESVIPAAQGALSQLWQVVFLYPDSRVKTITAAEAHKQGYGVNTTSNRVVFRAPFNASESQVTEIQGHLVEVLRATVFYKQRWMILLVDTSVACSRSPPTFTKTTLSWTVPRIYTPLVLDVGKFVDKFIGMGVSGQVISNYTLDQRNYRLRANSTIIEIAIPIGAEGGLTKSDVIANQYGTTYSIHLLLDHHWVDDLWERTRHCTYKRIVAPMQPQIPVVINDTIPETRVFNITLGHFLLDVELISITIANQPLTPDEARDKGFQLYDVPNPNGTKAFVLQVPFDHELVDEQYLENTTRRFTLHVNFTMIVKPDNKVFTHPATIICDLVDVVFPTSMQECGEKSIRLLVTHGNADYYWVPYVRDFLLTQTRAEELGYSMKDNGTLFLLEVPLFAVGLIYEEINIRGLMARLDVHLKDKRTMRTVVTFSAVCYFPTGDLLVCFQNGTMVATVLRTSTVPEIDPRRTTLRNRACKPTQADETKAIFSFSVTSCGTTGRIDRGYLIYENEISFQRAMIPFAAPVITRDPEYRLTLQCRYPVNGTQWLGAGFVGSFVPSTSRGVGWILNDEATGSKRTREVLNLQSRMAKDATFSDFYLYEEHPVVKYVSEPLYFEIELLSENPHAELVLGDCWATGTPEFDGTPQWDIIADGCEMKADTHKTHLLPVTDQEKDALHFKRFEVTTFLSSNVNTLWGRVYFHCSATVCDIKPADVGICNRCASGKHSSVHRNYQTIQPKGFVSTGAVEILLHEKMEKLEQLGKPDDAMTWILPIAFALSAMVLLLILFFACKN
nr:PREDICTED: uncharacterized protein LOC102359505 isoform X2 [Latimeria chalumnae]XP_014346143.1 PREDICTED: uncharacterized protein LOC102359505 isoform X2 [Latimeria chalumnae]|eukprot:XP_014346142.1 PREDICTED: uncharacterized protein LOC102359505 isoform X2 [Latimeria chalumnae]